VNAARRTSAYLLVVTLVALLFAAFPVAADPVQVRAAVQSDTARLVFNWPAPVTYDASLDGTTLRIRFGRSVAADVAAGLAGASTYVSSARLLGDGQTVEVAMNPGNYRLNHFTAGNAVVIDVQGTPSPQAAEAEPAPEPAAAPEPQPEPEPVATAEAPATETTTETTTEPTPAPTPAAAPASGPEIGVRTGRHADKLRVVFDWLNEVPYELTRGDGVATIAFGAPARIDMASLNGVAPELIGEARSRGTSNGTAVDLAVPDSARINLFRAGEKVVADIFFPTDGAVAGRLPALASTAEAAPAPQPEPAAEPDSPVEVVAAEPAETQAEPTAETVEQTSDQPASLEVPTEETSIESLQGVSGLQVDTGAAASGGDIPIRVGPREDGEPGFALAFDWTNPVGAAVFRRGGALWLVFDQFTPVDVNAVKQTAGNNLIDIVQLQNPSATVLRMITGNGINPIAKRNGLTWLIEFKEQELSTLAPIQATPQLDSPVGSRVFLPVPEPGRPVVVTDPEIGDNFVVVPIIPLGYGVTHLYQYPQFRVRPSSQGAVIEPRIDTLRVRPLREGIEVTSTRTLHISPVSLEELARTGIDDDRALTRLVDFEPLKGVERQFLFAKRRVLERDIATTDDPALRARRELELAKFYLAHGYGAEALGVLRIRGENFESAAREPEHQLLVGMSNFLLHRPADAVNALESPELRINDEGNFWRSISGFAAGNLSGEVLRGIRSTARIPEPYPPKLRVPMTLWAIEGVLQAGDAIQAETMLETLAAEDLSEEEAARRQLLMARAARINGDTEIAVAQYEQAASRPAGPSQARAVVERVEMMLELDRISASAAAEELETLRYGWRGGEFEFGVLRKLGNLYLRSGNFRDGLSTLRQAATYFRDHPDAPKVTETMVQAFNALFLEGLADRISPVSAIAIYEEFKELTPAGRRGDTMIQNLADRLAKVDLLDQAAALLDAQIKFRLTGVDRARVGNQLALIHLLNGQYEQAINALDLSADPAITPELEEQRRLLRARGLMGMDRDAAALALIEDDESLAADQLRAEMHWDQGNWLEASKALRNLLGHDGIRPGQQLEEDQAILVLNYAIALTLAGNDRAIAHVNRDYGAAMAQTELAEPFKLIATPERFGLLDVSQVADKVREAEAFGTFLAEYKEQLATTPLSAIN